MVGRILQLAMIAMALGCEAALVPAKEEIIMLFEINMLCPFIAITTFISIVVIQFVYAQNSPTSYTLTASPRTIHWGHLSSELKPVCTIDSGDIVTVETFGSCSPDEYEAAGIAHDLIPQALRDMFREVRDRGPGVHILTGPIYINRADSGDMLEVHIKDTKLTMPFGYNRIRDRGGTLPEDFPYDSTRVLRIDVKRMTSEVIPGVVVPLSPFFGTMAVAPPSTLGKISSGPPGIYGGNMDNKELISGTVLYLPIHVKGALFSVGDGHAAQGDGEVDSTALETAVKGKFQFFVRKNKLFVRKNKRIRWPRAETPTHFITMGFNQDLDVAVQMAVREVIDFLGEAKGINREDAYRIASLAVDLHVTQVVNGIKGVHAMIPKTIFVKK
jgi:acetamidase/formamidase